MDFRFSFCKQALQMMILIILQTNRKVENEGTWLYNCIVPSNEEIHLLISGIIKTVYVEHPLCSFWQCRIFHIFFKLFFFIKKKL